MITSPDILACLDRAADKGRFPPVQMDDYYSAGIRLKVFLQADEWLIVLESLDFTTTDYTFLSNINAFGNNAPRWFLPSKRTAHRGVRASHLWRT